MKKTTQSQVSRSPQTIADLLHLANLIKFEDKDKVASIIDKEVAATREQKISANAAASPSTPTPQIDMASEETVPAKKREHFVKSAGYWFDAARKAQDEGKMPDALMCMENAYNHLENAYAAAQDILEWIQRNYDGYNSSGGQSGRDLDMLSRVRHFFNVRGSGIHASQSDSAEPSPKESG